VVSLRIRHGQLIRLDFHQLDCSLVGCSDARAEIALNILGFLIGLYYAAIIKTRCPPASPEPRDGGQAPGVLHHVMGRGIERKRLFIDKRDRQDFNTRLAALAFEKLCTFCTSVA